MEAKLRGMKLRSHIHRKGKRGKPLTEQAKSSNRTKSTVRARVEHVFGAQTNDMGGTLVRTIGLVRAKAKISLLQAEPTVGKGPQNPTTRGTAGLSTHVVRDGDSLQSVAHDAYGDPTLWRRIAEANGIDDPLSIPRGTVLSIPTLMG